jgi:hypothetical protein
LERWLLLHWSSGLDLDVLGVEWLCVNFTFDFGISFFVPLAGQDKRAYCLAVRPFAIFVLFLFTKLQRFFVQ